MSKAKFVRAHSISYIVTSNNGVMYLERNRCHNAKSSHELLTISI